MGRATIFRTFLWIGGLGGQASETFASCGGVEVRYLVLSLLMWMWLPSNNPPNSPLLSRVVQLLLRSVDLRLSALCGLLVAVDSV